MYRLHPVEHSSRRYRGIVRAQDGSSGENGAKGGKSDAKTEEMIKGAAREFPCWLRVRVVP